MTYTYETTDPECAQYPLYDARWEHDACGTGFLAHVSGEASHSLIQTALTALARLTHRGAQDADAETYDGAGILTQIPRTLLHAELEQQHITGIDPDDLAVGMIFLPSEDRTPAAAQESRRIIEQTLTEAGLLFLSWRTPPLDYGILSTRAREIAPTIAQVLLARPAYLTPDEYGRTLYRARRLIEQRLRIAQIADCYIVSLSDATLIYKGLLAPTSLSHFYLDLADPRYTSALAVFHQRYSTNTFPAWPLAQPMRLLAHNGEINTVQGNHNWMQAREGALSSPLWDENIRDLLPVIQAASDSAKLDNALELLTFSGRDVLHSMQMLVPPAWEQDSSLDEEQRAWCEYHAGITEPWDGPAALVFTDGRVVAAALDRNGLRPARYTLTASGFLIVASEAGVVHFDPADVVEKGRLGPGEMIAVDVELGLFLRNHEIKEVLARRQPYQQWLEEHMVRSEQLFQQSAEQPTLDAATLFARQQLFGYTHEDVEMILRPMLMDHKEPTWSMGDDAPLAVLSGQSRSFSDYFRQRFAQVTNPPIDPLRERIVMSLDSYLGRRQSLLNETARHARMIHLKTPLLTEAQLNILRAHDPEDFQTRTLSATFETTGGIAAFASALDRLEQEAVDAITAGTTLLVLSDNDATLEQAPLPMLIAIGALHRGLIKRGLRDHVSLIAETSSVCDIHQIALLLGYGAEAIVPTLALASVRALAGERRLEHLTHEMAVETYIQVVEDGLRKVMARMGISTLRNIIGAGQFEVIGLHPSFVERCFAGSAMHPGNVTSTHIAEAVIKRCETLAQEQESAGANEANNRRRKLTDLGRYRFRRDAEYHAYNPLVIRALQKAAQTGAVEDYRQFTALVYSRPTTALRDLLSFKPSTAIPLEQ
ncbi:MAG TPA: glutamate synthase central domain-containing protein, partial [Ktedonosporobacter sp.]|nr:glutamate synthase central domain-containing protein [Ktedonosporobacter sp.]